MKNVLLLLVVCLLLCGGCKYFKKSSSRMIDTISADTMEEPEEFIDSAAYYSSGTEPADEYVSPAPAMQQTTPQVTASSTVSGRYYMIVGSFSNRSNADRLVVKLRGMGYSPEIILGPDNLSMVSAKSYGSYSESIRDIDDFRNNVNQNAWVYSKK